LAPNFDGAIFGGDVLDDLKAEDASRSYILEELAPPKIAATDECAHLACFRIDEVTVMHSVITRDTGSTAIGIVPLGPAGTSPVFSGTELDIVARGKGSRRPLEA
jgi:hypothetical protein